MCSQSLMLNHSKYSFCIKQYNFFLLPDFSDSCLNPATPSLLSQEEFLEIIAPATTDRCQSLLSPLLPHPPFRDSSRNIMTHSMNMGSLGCLVLQHMGSSHQWESSRNPEITAPIQVSTNSLYWLLYSQIHLSDQY